MAEELTQKLAVITIDVDSGELINIEVKNGAQKYDMQEGELKAVHGQVGAGYDTVAWIVHSHSSPGCLRWIGGSLVKIC